MGLCLADGAAGKFGLHPLLDIRAGDEVQKPLGVLFVRRSLDQGASIRTQLVPSLG